MVKKLGRKSFDDDFNEEIDSISQQLADMDAQKATKEEVANALDGSPKDVFATLADLQATFPTGAQGVYLVEADGHIYSWDGSTWADRGVYQATGIADRSLTNEKIAENTIMSNNVYGELLNIFDLEKAMIGYTVNASGTLVANATWTTSELIPVVEGDVINLNIGQYTYLFTYDANGIYTNFISGGSSKIARTYTVTSGVGYIRLHVLTAEKNNYMATKNQPLPAYYISGSKKSLKWLKVTEENFEGDPLAYQSDWYGATGDTLGDSITWQDGKAYASSGLIARGYQTHLKEKLGFSLIRNHGVSGRPMANGTVNGSGTNTTGKALTYADSHLVTIAAATNDFKLNVPLGALGQMGDTVFDTNTFYGAYRDLIEYILTNNSNVRIVLFTPLQRNTTGYGVNDANTAGHKLVDYVNAIIKTGEMYGLPVCDLYRNSGFNNFTLPTFTMDGLHPNDIGYEVMGGYMAHFIANVGRVKVAA